MEMRRSKERLRASAHAMEQRRTLSPGDSGAVGAGEGFGQQTILGERVGDAGVAEHEGVEHAGAVEEAAEDDGEGETGADDGAGGVGPCSGGELGGGDSGEADGGEWQDVGDGHECGGDEHGAGIVALRTLDLLSDGGGVVPAHVVPEGDGDGSGEVVADGWWSHGRDSGGVVSGCESLPEAGGDEHGEGSKQQDEHADGAFADDYCSAEVPEGAEEDDGESPEGSAVACGPERFDAAEIGDEDDGVDGHVEDAGGEREPGFLESPEAAECATDPAVVATLFGQRGGEFADHERGGEAPDERHDEQ